MTSWYCTSDDLPEAEKSSVGGKGAALARLQGQGFTVPPFLCVTTRAYQDVVRETGIRDRIVVELGRKAFADMRWEELWDLSLRIRNLFVTTALPSAMRTALQQAVAEVVGEGPAAVRSSAPDEDAEATSFAGVHESYLNVRGASSILDHIKLVWASLWSHRALLYRRSLDIDVRDASMAVVVQALVAGQASGVVFSRDPTRAGRCVIEAVHGLNEGLVDGRVEPDRWIVGRKDGQLLEHAAPERSEQMALQSEGTAIAPLPAGLIDRPPLSSDQVRQIWQLGQRAEQQAGCPQDVEWTLRDGTVFVLQARPITTVSKQDPDDETAWYLSLERNLDDLRGLRDHIEQVMLPGMTADAARFAKADLAQQDDSALADSLQRRAACYEDWRKQYWDYCIPFAHGMRLFGEVYTDQCRPDDPYEFLEVLKDDHLLSVERNRALQAMADILRDDPETLAAARNGTIPAVLRQAFSTFMERFASVMQLADADEASRTNRVARLLARMAEMDRTAPGEHSPRVDELTTRFLDAFGDERRDYARDLLEIGRASYRLRDDDNVYLEGVEAELTRASKEARKRVELQRGADLSHASPQDLIELLRDPSAEVPEPQAAAAESDRSDPSLRYRQLVGQPAGAGVAKGRARVILEADDIFDFEEGDILVCDAVDPGITFVVPLARAVVERRGGMLIHGAIIAREYRLPCVTGVPDATRRIPSGATITVDGFLGIVTVDTEGWSDVAPAQRQP